MTPKVDPEERTARDAASARRIAEAADRRSLLAIQEVGQVAARLERLETDLFALRRALANDEVIFP
jgi:hypothetical protein